MFCMIHVVMVSSRISRQHRISRPCADIEAVGLRELLVVLSGEASRQSELEIVKLPTEARTPSAEEIMILSRDATCGIQACLARAEWIECRQLT